MLAGIARYASGVSHVLTFVLAAVALAASIYLVYLLEILKFKHRRTGEIRRAEPDTSEHEIEEQVRRDVETGEFERVR